MGNAKISNLNKIQTFQNIALRKLLNAPLASRTRVVHSDLKIKLVHKKSKIYYSRFHNRLTLNSNPLIKSLTVPTNPGNPRRHLKRKWCSSPAATPTNQS